MLSQFRLRHPQGSLISELVQIDHGKYIVRALVQVEGVTLASGLAAADTVEKAEDQARIRALSLLNWEETTVTPLAMPTDSVTPKSPKTGTQKGANKVVPLTEKTESIPPVVIPQNKPETSLPPQPQVLEIPPITPTPEPEIQSVTSILESPTPIPEEKIPAITPTPEPEAQPVTSLLDSSTPIPEVLFPEIINEPVLEKSVTAKNVETVEIPLELIQSVSEPSILESLEMPSELLSSEKGETPIAESIPEPIDFSDIIVRSNVELKRLSWTNEQGRNYLLQTYGKRSRQLLSDEELLEFLQYLETQPTPAVK